MSDYIEWGALANVLLLGLVIGAGVPALFAVGVRAIAGPGARNAEGQLSLTRKIAGGACFAVIVVAIVAAIVFLAAGGHA